MPYALHVSPEARTARIRVEGTLNGAEIIAACRGLVEHEDWRAGYATLWDFRDLRALLLLPADVDAFAAMGEGFAEKRGPGRSAFVTDDPSVHINALLLALKTRGKADVGAQQIPARGTMRCSHGREFRVFARIEAAEAWLAEGDRAWRDGGAPSTRRRPRGTPEP